VPIPAATHFASYRGRHETAYDRYRRTQILLYGP